MTFIAIATYGQSATIVTDTSAYSTSMRTCSRSSKVTPIPYLDLVIGEQGDLGFAAVNRVQLEALAGRVGDFDDFLAQAPLHMRKVMETVQADPPKVTQENSTSFLVGYSPARGRFVAYGYASEQDFEPFEIEGLFIHPSPLPFRPSDMEMGRLTQAEASPTNVEALRTRPVAPKPVNRDDWLTLAFLARDRAIRASVGSGLVVPVTGQIWQTELTRGSITMEMIHEFDDSADRGEFRKIVEGSLHPTSQLGPCDCHSGERAIDCCMIPFMDKPCSCGSGKSLRDCCAITADDQTVDA